MHKLVNRLRNRKGFSLMELILVVAIMGILAGILTPMIFASREQAKDAKCQAELDAIGSAARAYYADNSTFAGRTVANLVADGYLSEVKDDPWGNDYGLLVSWTDADNDGRPESPSIVAAYSMTDQTAAGTDHAACGAIPTGSTDLAAFLGHVVTVINM